MCRYFKTSVYDEKIPNTSLSVWREGDQMAEVKVGKGESLESALRRFKRATQKAGILSEVRKREHYEKPSVARKKKSEAARKRKSR